MTCCYGNFGTVAALQFTRDRAAKELQRYRRKQVGATTRLLRDALMSEGLGQGKFLDIGAGVGALTFELLEHGAAGAVVVEASPAYLEAVSEEAARRGHTRDIELVRGDFVDVAGSVPAAYEEHRLVGHDDDGAAAGLDGLARIPDGKRRAAGEHELPDLGRVPKGENKLRVATLTECCLHGLAIELRRVAFEANFKRAGDRAFLILRLRRGAEDLWSTRRRLPADADGNGEQQGSDQDCRSAHAFSSLVYLLFFHRLIDSGAPLSSRVVSVSTPSVTCQCRGLFVASGPPPVAVEDGWPSMK